MKDRGRKGFFGVGKKPNTYEVIVFKQASVKVAFRSNARLSIQVGKPTFCARCKKQIASGQALLVNSQGLCKTYDELQAFPFDNQIASLTNSSRSICYTCLKKLSREKLSFEKKEPETNIKLPTYLGMAASHRWKMNRSHETRPSVNKERCVHCHEIQKNFYLAAFHDNEQVNDWFWLCESCWHNWYYSPEIFAAQAIKQGRYGLKMP
ncbi:hypothetical protein MJD09_23210 [bacterium]|nr:hypothetical protein [bacterium]